MTTRRASSLRSFGRFTPPGRVQSTAPPARSGPCKCPACQVEDGMAFDFDAEWERMQGIIGRSGHCIQYVMADPGGFDWAYTIGRVRKGQPELLVTGVEPEVAAMMLNEIVKGWDAMWSTPDGVFTLPGSHRHQCRLSAVPDSVWDSEYLLGAQRDVEEQGLIDQREALQVLWADSTHIYPGDVGASAFSRKRQPIIGLL